MLTQLYGAALLASETAEHVELPMASWLYAVIIFGALLLGLFVTMSYTNVGRRHSPAEEHPDPHRQHTNKHDGPSHH
jgi:hypothetical protein